MIFIPGPCLFLSAGERKPNRISESIKQQKEGVEAVYPGLNL
jgi:hypothetical protein